MRSAIDCMRFASDLSLLLDVLEMWVKGDTGGTPGRKKLHQQVIFRSEHIQLLQIFITQNYASHQRL
jgi:hypothetical protein